MALFDFLKRKKEVEKSKPARIGATKGVSGRKPAEKKAEKISDVKEKKVHPVKSSEAGVLPKAKQFNRAGFSYNIIKEPHISEKATNLADTNKYVFKVYHSASKLEIKKSIEGIHKVNVLSVNTIKIPAKKRRLGKTEGFKKGYRKAIVTIKEGQKIEIL